MDFEAYLISKKIDSVALKRAEPGVWATWMEEFNQIHPKSFTAQKLYLINPVRRKYPLKEDPEKKVVGEEPQVPGPPVAGPVKSGTPASKPVIPRPVFKPKPKTN